MEEARKLLAEEIGAVEVHQLEVEAAKAKRALEALVRRSQRRIALAFLVGCLCGAIVILVIQAASLILI